MVIFRLWMLLTVILGRLGEILLDATHDRGTPYTVILRFVLSLLLALLIGTFVLPAFAAPVTEQEVREIFNAARRQNDDRRARYSIETTARELSRRRGVDGSQSPPDVPPTLHKYGGVTTTPAPPPGSPPVAATIPPAAAATHPRKPSWSYAPPARNASNNPGQSFAAEAPPITFGIDRGAWIQISLDDPANSAEPGDMSVTTVNDVQGRIGTLPAGTTLFGGRRYNSGTDRLDLVITSGQTPDGQEFPVSGHVYDSNRSAGLDGVTKQIEIAKGAAAAGGLAAANAALGAIADGNPATAGIVAAGDVALQQGDQQAAQLLQPSAVIYVDPQDGWIRLTGDI